MIDKRVLKGKIPWWLKISAKILLYRLPVGYRVWKRLGIFEHGDMQNLDYALGVFNRHFERGDIPRSAGWVGLELGPGDSLLSAVLAHAFGASGSYLIDVEHNAAKDLRPYQDLAALLVDRGLPARDVLRTECLGDLLRVCNAKYMTNGLSSLRAIPDQSVDFVWSQATLEHVGRSEFRDTMWELHRVLRADGWSSHSVDLKDHLGNALNNLRFGERFWESRWTTNSGIYNNRIRYSEMLRIFQDVGFLVEVVEVNRWDRLPTPRSKLSRDFRDLSDEELCVSTFDVILRPQGQSPLQRSPGTIGV